MNVVEKGQVGEKLPKGWKFIKLGDLCLVKGGKRLPANTDFASKKTSFPYIRVVDFDAGTVSLNNLKYLEEETHLKIARYVINRGDVYISIAGTIGIVGTIPDLLHGANLTENAAKLVVKELNVLCRDYLARFLQSPVGQQAIKLRTNIVGQPKLALERIATIEIPLPPLPEQKRIVGILSDRLSTIDKARAATEAQLQAINALPAALLRQAFNGEL